MRCARKRACPASKQHGSSRRPAAHRSCGFRTSARTPPSTSTTSRGADMPHVTFIHGIANKPKEDELRRIWVRALEEAAEPLSLSNEGVTSSMVYWADLMYAAPITDTS